MNQRNSTALLSALMAVLAFGETPAVAQDGTKTSSAKPLVELGFEERVRSEEWDSIPGSAKDANGKAVDHVLQDRFRTRVWAEFNPSQDLQIVAGLCNENRHYISPDKATNGRQIFFDTLYLDYRFNPEWSVRVGRQNLQRGDGFILFEGDPVDGSRSFYFNALDVTRYFGNSKLEFMAISNPALDKYLPRINEPSNPADVPRLTEWDEKALGLYYTGKEWQDTTLEAYYFFKTEMHDYRPSYTFTGGDVIPNPSFQPNRHISTLGTRAEHSFGDGWSGSGEFAYQWGQVDAYQIGHSYIYRDNYDKRDIAAWAGTARLKKAFDTSWKPALSVGYIAMSGDDPKTEKFEGWDPLFARYPKFSELYLYSLVPEKGVGYWSNNGMWELSFTFKPCSKTDVRATYYHMTAFESPAAQSSIFGTGKGRGDILEFRTDVKFDDQFKGHVVCEHLAPGDFYTSRNGAYFLRFELSYTFKKRF